MFLRDLWKRRAEKQRAEQLSLAELRQRLADLGQLLDPTFDHPAMPGRTWFAADLELLFPLLLDHSLAATEGLADNARALEAQYRAVLQALQVRIAQQWPDPDTQAGATVTYTFPRTDENISALHARFAGTLDWLKQRATQQTQRATALGSAVPMVAWDAALYEYKEHLGDESGIESAIEMGRAGSKFTGRREPSRVVTACTPATLAAEAARLGG